MGQGGAASRTWGGTSCLEEVYETRRYQLMTNRGIGKDRSEDARLGDLDWKSWSKSAQSRSMLSLVHSLKDIEAKNLYLITIQEI